MPRRRTKEEKRAAEEEERLRLEHEAEVKRKEEEEEAYKLATELYLEAIQLQGVQRFDEAMQRYLDAFKVKPDHVGARFNYALLLERSNKSEEAKAQFARCAEIAKEQPVMKNLVQNLVNYAGV